MSVTLEEIKRLLKWSVSLMEQSYVFFFSWFNGSIKNKTNNEHCIQNNKTKRSFFKHYFTIFYFIFIHLSSFDLSVQNMFANNCVICYCMLSSGVLYIWKCPNFHTVLDQNKIQHLLGEQADIGREEAICVRSWGKTRRTTWKSVVSFLQTDPSPHSILLYMCVYYWFILYVRASSQWDLATVS